MVRPAVGEILRLRCASAQNDIPVTVLSPTAVVSPEVRGELRTALDENKPILPVVYQKYRIPRQLRTIQYVDFTSPGPGDEAALEQVIRALAESKKSPPQEAEVPGEVTLPPVEGKQEAIAREVSQQPGILKPQVEEDLRQKVAEGRQERLEGGVRWSGEEETPRRATSPTEETRLIPPWLYGGIGMLVVLVIALFLRGQQQTKKTESVRPEIPVAEPPQTPVAAAPVQEREEQKTTQGEQLKEKERGDRKEMVSIPAREFWMGCNEEVDQTCYGDEKPGRKVSLDAYSIGKYEVTVVEYRRCVEAGGKGCISPSTGGSCNWGKEGREDHPINCVDWNQAQGYCQWAGKRLPTEAEWEKAARGADGRVYPWGNQWEAKRANVGSSGTAAVGSYSAGVSPYGSYDMAGNVWEWVQDWYAEDYYQRSPVRNPKGPNRGENRVMRGGSWFNVPSNGRVSTRVGYGLGSRSDRFGFRCAQ